MECLPLLASLCFCLESTAMKQEVFLVTKSYCPYSHFATLFGLSDSAHGNPGSPVKLEFQLSSIFFFPF